MRNAFIIGHVLFILPNNDVNRIVYFIIGNGAIVDFV